MGFICFTLSSNSFEVSEISGWCSRNACVIEMVREAYSELKDMSKTAQYVFQIHTGDKMDLNWQSLSPHNNASSNVYSIACTIDKIDNHGAPCWAFESWRELDVRPFDAITRELSCVGRIEAPIPRVFWSGSANYVSERIAFKKLAQTMPDYVICNDFHSWTTKGPNKSKGFISMVNQVQQYKALIDITGVGYSARMKFLTHSHRPLLISNRTYWDWPMHLMQPNIHYVPVKANFSDLLAKAKWVFENYDKAKIIANDAAEFASTNVTHANAIKRYKEIILNSQLTP